MLWHAVFHHSLVTREYAEPLRSNCSQESRLSRTASPGSSWDSEGYLISNILRTVSGSPWPWLRSVGDGIKSSGLWSISDVCILLSLQRCCGLPLFVSQQDKDQKLMYHLVLQLLGLTSSLEMMLPKEWEKFRSTIVTKYMFHVLCSSRVCWPNHLNLGYKILHLLITSQVLTAIDT